MDQAGAEVAVFHKTPRRGWIGVSNYAAAGERRASRQQRDRSAC